MHLTVCCRFLICCVMQGPGGKGQTRKADEEYAFNFECQLGTVSCDLA
jgi:hypothetical protein